MFLDVCRQQTDDGLVVGGGTEDQNDAGKVEDVIDDLLLGLEDRVQIQETVNHRVHKDAVLGSELAEASGN